MNPKPRKREDVLKNKDEAGANWPLGWKSANSRTDKPKVRLPRAFQL